MNHLLELIMNFIQKHGDTQDLAALNLLKDEIRTAGLLPLEPTTVPTPQVVSNFADIMAKLDDIDLKLNK